MPALKKPAADLRSKYQRYLKISLILSLSFLIIAFQFSPYPSESETIPAVDNVPIVVTYIPETIQRPKPPPPPPPEIPEEIEVFVWSEVMPEPVGGFAAIQNKVKYTEIAKRIGLEGTVYIEATIDENGNIIDLKTIKKIGGGLDEEALNAVAGTKFKPGFQRGKPIKVRITIPIKFVLK
jgi:protein TonB